MDNTMDYTDYTDYTMDSAADSAVDYTEKTLEVEEIFRGRIVHVHRDRVSLPDGSTSIREIVDHSGGAAVLPVDEQGNTWCVRQYRYATGRHILEAPAGKLESGEDPLVCAKRELREETGFSADTFIPMGFFWPSPGYCREKIYLYLALNLHKGEKHLDPGEFLDVQEFKLAELFDMAVSGEIEDGKTLLLILKSKLFLDGKG